VKKIQTERTASQRADEGRKKRPALFILILCLLMAVGIVISAAMLGESLSRFSRKESNVIPLAPRGEALRAVEEGGVSRIAEGEDPEEASGTATPQPTAAQRVEYQGALQIYDAVRSWSTETQVDLFKESYNETAQAEDGGKIVAPGTSNFYSFTLENDGNLPLDYTISLKVESFGTEAESEPNVPLEWRLLAGDGAALSDWRGYTATAEPMKRGTLAARNRNNYTIEWRWDFERGEDMDRADTELGDLAARQPLGAEATIIVYAEEQTTPSGGLGKPLWPKTGDSSDLGVYIVLMSISGGGLLLLFQSVRPRKKRE